MTTAPEQTADPLVQQVESTALAKVSTPSTTVARPVPNVVPMEQLCAAMAKSGYFADIREAGQAIVKIQAGAELGIGPVAALTQIYIVKGRVSLSANLMATMVRRSGRYDYRVRHWDNTGCSIEFLERVGDKRESLGVSSFTEADARVAKLGGDNWAKYPRNMMFARAMSNGVRVYCPDVTSGNVYTPDELGLIVGEDGAALPTQPRPTPESDPDAPVTQTRAERTQAKPTTPANPITDCALRFKQWKPEASGKEFFAWARVRLQLPESAPLNPAEHAEKIHVLLDEAGAPR